MPPGMSAAGGNNLWLTGRERPELFRLRFSHGAFLSLSNQIKGIPGLPYPSSLAPGLTIYASVVLPKLISVSGTCFESSCSLVTIFRLYPDFYWILCFFTFFKEAVNYFGDLTNYFDFRWEG